MDFWVTIIVMGLSFSVLLFMISSGLSLVFGLMNVLNLTHGGYYLIGLQVQPSVVIRSLDDGLSETYVTSTFLTHSLPA